MISAAGNERKCIQLKYLKKIGAMALSLLLLLSVCPGARAAAEDVYTLILNGDSAKLDGVTVPEYDYIWHADPSRDYGQVKNSPAEYYTGTEPTGEDMVYIAHDIYYYPQLDESKFTQINYDGETEWAYMYEAEGYENYIFSTLPVLRSGFPSHMMHSEEEAYQNPVLHITQPGTYRLQGSWQGQIRVDLGEDAFDDPDARVTLILDGVDVDCTVAAGLVFAQVYECDNTWEDREEYSQYVDTSTAGANVVIADGTENSVSGTNIYRILKTKYKDENSRDAYPAQKKQLKEDGAFYSYMSMNITGEAEGSGMLTIESRFEGLNSELHLTLSGGNIRILADNDGINVNEDGVSVLTVTGGNLSILGGLGDEGDGIDSNGFVLVKGGTVITSANPAADSGLDSDCGSFVQGGTVMALGSAMDWAETDGGKDVQPVMNLRFSQSRSAEDAVEVTDLDGNVLFSCIPGFAGRTYTGMVLSCPELKAGESYLLSIGGEVQCWSDSELGGFGMPGQRSEDMQADPGQRPGGRGQGQPGQGQIPPDGQMPEGMESGQTPSEGVDFDRKPGNGGMDRGDFPNGMDRGGRGGMMEQGGATCTFEKTFHLSDGVNAFSSVSDYRHDIIALEDGSAYQCIACGAVFADAEGTALPEESQFEPQPGTALWWIVGICVPVLIGGAVAAVILIRKRKKK